MAMDFAPVSGEPSTRLKLVTGYFSVSGYLSAAALSLWIVVSLIRAPGVLLQTILDHPLRVLAAVGTSAGLLWTARELREGRKTGWYGALLTVAASIAPMLTGGEMSRVSMIVAALGIGLVVSIRDELE